MKTIIEMAREAGWKDLRNNDSEMHDHIFMGNIDTFKALVELARADEREACAKVCDARYMGDNNREDTESRRCAEAIRASMTIQLAAGNEAFYGFPHGPVSTPNAGGKCVTAGETAPKEST